MDIRSQADVKAAGGTKLLGGSPEAPWDPAEERRSCRNPGKKRWSDQRNSFSLTGPGPNHGGAGIVFEVS